MAHRDRSPHTQSALPAPANDGVQVWSDGYLVKWNWDVPRVFQTAEAKRKDIDAHYPPFRWRHVLYKPPLRGSDDYLVASIRSFVDAVHGVKSELFVSGHDLRQALEIA